MLNILKGSPSFVLSRLTDIAAWSSNGLAWLVSLIRSNLPFLMFESKLVCPRPWGYDSYLRFERSARLAMCIAFSFTLGDLQTDLETPSRYNFTQAFFGVTVLRKVI